MGILSRAFRNVSRRKTRALLVVIALAFSISIMVSILQGTAANQAAAENIASTYSETLSTMQDQFNKSATLIEVSASSGRYQITSGPGGGQGFPVGTPPGGEPGEPQVSQAMSNNAFVNDTTAEEISTLSGVKDLLVYLECSSNETVEEPVSAFGGPSGGRNFTISRPVYTVQGVSLNSTFIEEYGILPSNITAGRNLQEGDHGVCLLASNLTAYFGVDVGDTVSINGTSLTVVGVYEPATSEGRTSPKLVYMSLEDAQAVTGMEGMISRLDVYAQNTTYVTSISEAIELAYNEELFVTNNDDRLQNLQNMQNIYQSTIDNAETSLAQSQIIATQEIIIAVTATSLIVLFVMLYTVRERTKEIGTLKAIGFSSGNIMNQFVLEGTLLSLVAGAVGIAIGSVAAPMLSSLLLPSLNLFRGGGAATSGGVVFRSVQSSFAGPVSVGGDGVAAAASVDPMLMLVAFGTAVLLGVVGSLYPAWRASRIRPAEAMRYE